MIFTPQINKNQKLMLFNTAWGRKLGAPQPSGKALHLKKTITDTNTSCSKAFTVMLFILRKNSSRRHFLCEINHIPMSTHAFKL